MSEKGRLSVVGEPADSTLPERSREAMASLVRYAEAKSTYQELMHLACAFEHAARKKKEAR